MKNPDRQRRRRRKKLAGALLLLICITSMLAGYVTAKYKFQKVEEPLYTAEAFYFESDLLSNSQIVPSYTYRAGSDLIQVSLYNYADSLRYSEGDLSYRVEVTDAAGQPVTDISGNPVADVTGTIAAGQTGEAVIKFSDLPAGNYVVTATAEGKYQKILRGNFTLAPTDKDITYTVSDSAGSPVLLLTVTTKDYSGNVALFWPEGTAPDSTDSWFAGIDSGYGGGSCTMSFSNHSEYTFQFFKKDPASVYDASQFQVKKGE